MLRICACQSDGFEAEPVITLDGAAGVVLVMQRETEFFLAPGYSSPQMRRLMQPTIALPSMASSRFLEVFDDVSVER